MAVHCDGLGVHGKIYFYNCEIEGKIKVVDYDCEFYNCNLNITGIELKNSTLLFNNCTIVKPGTFVVDNSNIKFDFCKIPT